MNVIKTEIDGVIIIEPKVFGDERGYFFESFSQKDFEEQVCPGVKFVQDNESKSCYGVVRGLHFQKPPFAQSKLVRVVKGVVLDVAVDLRKESPTYGKHIAVELSETNHRQMFIPQGFAHGFAVLSDEAIFQYKCDNFYAPKSEGAIAWDDPDLGIDWKIPSDKVILSEKDKHHPKLKDLKTKPLVSIIVPVYNAEPYLRECIESIQNQELTNIEIILIDDGSKDNSGKICDEYAAKDSRIKVVHKTNSGQADSRNMAIGMASADVIGFIDSDDWIDPKMFSTLYGLMAENEADISICECYYSYKNKERVYYNPGQTEIYDTDKALDMLLNDTDIKSYLCNKLFKKMVITEPLPVSRVYEDHATVFKWFSNAHKVARTTTSFYHYRQRKSSTVNLCDPSKDYDFFLAECERHDYLLKHGLIKENDRQLDIKLVAAGIKSIKEIVRKDCDEAVAKPFIDKIMAKMQEFLPVKMNEIGFKPYLRLKLLQNSLAMFKFAMRIGKGFANNNKLKNREFYE